MEFRVSLPINNLNNDVPNINHYNNDDDEYGARVKYAFIKSHISNNNMMMMVEGNQFNVMFVECHEWMSFSFASIYLSLIRC